MIGMNDLLLDFKRKLVLLNIKQAIIRKDVVTLDVLFHEVEDDINIAESYSKLIEIVSITNKNILDLNVDVLDIDNGNIDFVVADYIDFVDFINENIDFEIEILNNIISGIYIVSNYIYDENTFVLMMENYLEIDDYCYTHVRDNQKQLEKINKERVKKINE